MTTSTKHWPPVPSSSGAPDHGGGQTCFGAGGAKNLWVQTGRLWNLNLGTYNIRTLSSEADLAVLFEELRNVKWDILGLSEVRRTGEAFIKLADGHVLCYKGKDDRKECGVGFLINKRLAGNVDEFFSINERVAGITLKLNKRYHIKVIQVYAPTSTHNDEEVERFYEDVERAMKRNKTQFTFVIGDFNSKVGQKRIGETAVGNFGINNRNDRGDTLVDFAERNHLRIMNTFFHKKESRKWTWRGPNGTTRNEIDFILANRPDIVKDVTVLNRVNVGSDHRMVRCRIGLDLKIERNKLVKSIKPNLSKLREKTVEYEIEVQNRYSQLTDIEETVEDMCDNFTRIITEASLSIAGKTHKNTQGKLSEETKDLLRKRRNMTIRTARDQIEAAELSKTISKKKNEDIRKFNMTNIEETLRSGGSMKATKRMLAIGKNQMFSLRNSKGEIVNNRDEIINVAEEFYTKLYSSEERLDDVAQEHINNDALVPAVTIGEVRSALRDTKRGKASGSDNITIDQIKDAGEAALDKLAKLYTKCLENRKVPRAWKNANIILIHKKGDAKDLKNYRPISLLSVVYKLFTKIITNRIGKLLDSNQPREQAGFRSGYSTTDHMQTINQVIEKTVEFKKPLCMAFIDYEKAFDSVEISAVMRAIRKQGIDEAYVQTLEDIYNDGSATIKLHKESKKIPIKKGVRQGDTISPKLFTATLEDIFRNLEWDNKGINVNGEYLSNLRFADDIVLFSDSGEELQQMMAELNRESLKVGLKMNRKKTKVMFNSFIQPQQIKIDDEAIEVVEDYIYLGQNIKASYDHSREIKRRIGMGWSAFGKLNSIMNSKLPLSLKRKVYNQCVLPVLIYGSETWSITKGLERKLRSAQRGMERIMLGITWKDKKTASWIRNQTRVEDILSSIKRRKWTWAGHVYRRNDNRWTKAATEWQPRDGARGRGRPITRWRDEIRKFAGLGWNRRTSDRAEWRGLGGRHIPDPLLGFAISRSSQGTDSLIGCCIPLADWLLLSL